jgi:uncharacterized surface protein with fasciclin (FAS1) repeats
MKKIALIFLSLFLVPTLSFGTQPSSKNIMEYLSDSKDFTILVKGIKVVDREELYKRGGPITLFAPTDAAFKKLDPIILKKFLDNSKQVPRAASIVLYLTLDNQLTSEDLATKIIEGHGSATLKPEFREALIATRSGKDFFLTDTSKNVGRIIKPDILLKNGIIHVIDTVVMPKPTPGPSD